MPEKSPELSALGSAIADLRRERGASTDDVAKQAKIAPSFLEEIERGEKEATLLDVVAIADALGSDVQRLMARAGL
ncbi:MAG: helix-turn-helix domain-containing protein [Chthoniobacter sp.]|nr:helix-turn-helix domain-containing protein [Chthoniobacter sp.]